MIPHTIWYGRSDCFVIWTGPDNGRLDFELALGSASPQCHCKWEWSHEEVTFDLSIRYVPPWSCQAPSIFSSWIQGELHRYVVTNNRLEDFLYPRDALLERLYACGYGKPLIMQVFSQDVCQYARRATLLQQNGLPRERCAALCVRFHPILECMRIRQWLHDWQERIHTALKSCPRFVVAFKAGQHLIHILRHGVQTNCAEGVQLKYNLSSCVSWGTEYCTQRGMKQHVLSCTPACRNAGAQNHRIGASTPSKIGVISLSLFVRVWMAKKKRRHTSSHGFLEPFFSRAQGTQRLLNLAGAWSIPCLAFDVRQVRPSTRMCP